MSVRSCDARAIDTTSVPSKPPIKHTSRCARKARPAPAADVTRRSSRGRSPRARRLERLVARETTRETFRGISCRSREDARVDRGRETPSRGAHRSVGRIGFRGAAAAALDRHTPWTSRDRPTRGRDARDRGGDARWEKVRARSRERAVDRRVGRREIERGRGGRIGGSRFRVTSHDSRRKGS